MNQFTEVETTSHEATPMLREGAGRNFCNICQHEITLRNGNWTHDGQRP